MKADYTTTPIGVNMHDNLKKLVPYSLPIPSNNF